MRSFGFRLTLLAAILWASIGSTVWALGNHGEAIETVYVMPMATTLAGPHVLRGVDVLGRADRLRGPDLLHDGLLDGPPRAGAADLRHDGLCPQRAVRPPMGRGTAGPGDLRHDLCPLGLLRRRPAIGRRPTPSPIAWSFQVRTSPRPTASAPRPSPRRRRPTRCLRGSAAPVHRPRIPALAPCGASRTTGRA